MKPRLVLTGHCEPIDNDLRRLIPVCTERGEPIGLWVMCIRGMGYEMRLENLHIPQAQDLS